MYDRILLATDGSDHAERAARYVATLADRLGAEVDVLAVADLGAVAGPFDAGGVDAAFRERLREECRSRAERAAAVAGTDRTAVVEGRPRRTILDYADEHGSDLLATGTHGRTGIRRYVVGSVTEHVIRRATVPVLTARAVEAGGTDGDEGTGPARPAAIDRVLVPTDGSEPAAAAVDHAVAIAAACDARVRVVSVVNDRALAVQSELVRTDRLLDSLEEHAANAVRTVAKRCERAGVPVETAVARGAPARAICEDAEDADLVVMGSHGRSGLDRVLLGSVAERTVRHAPVPVVTVRAGE
jgi:nucleotide-binding universal stress UspA family protein